MTQQLSWEYNMKKLDIVSIYCIDSTYYGTWIIFYFIKPK